GTGLHSVVAAFHLDDGETALADVGLDLGVGQIGMAEPAFPGRQAHRRDALGIQVATAVRQHGVHLPVRRLVGHQDVEMHPATVGAQYVGVENRDLHAHWFTFPGSERSPDATLNTSTTHNSGLCTLALTCSAAVTPSNPPASTTPMSSKGTRTSTVSALITGLQPGLSMRIGKPGQVLGRRGLAPSGMSTTFNAPSPQASSGCSTTQCECQRSPSLSRRPSPFSSNSGVSSKSGCDVTAKARMPAWASKPTA